jgi:hypothetical protein
MIINSVLLILDCHLYYCLGGISFLGFACRYSNKNRREKKEKKEDM